MKNFVFLLNLVVMILTAGYFDNITAQTVPDQMEKVWPNKTSDGQNITTIPTDPSITHKVIGKWQIGTNIYPVYKGPSKDLNKGWYIIRTSNISGEKYRQHIDPGLKPECLLVYN